MATTIATGYANAPLKQGEPPDHGFLYTGKGLDFDGVADYIDTGSPFQSIFRDSYTLSAWIKPDDGQPYDHDESFFGQQDTAGDNSSFYFQVDDAGKLELKYMVEGTRIIAKDASATYSDGAESWHYVVAVVNNTTNQIYLYNDGKQLTLDGTDDGDIGALDLSNYGMSKNLFIGALNDHGNASQNFAGSISNAQVWDAVWSESDVQYAYTHPEKLASSNG